MNSVLEEKVIDFRDLLAAVVQKVTVIFVVAVLCAILFPTYKYIKDSKEATTSVGELSDDQKEQIETYHEKKMAYERMEAYVNDSDFMKLDPYNTVQEVMSYKVTDNLSASDVNGIIEVICRWMNGGGIEDVDNDLINCDNSIAKSSTDMEINSNVFTVTIWALDMSQLQDMSAIVQAKIDGFAANIQETYTFELTKVCDVSSSVYSSEVENRQKNIMSNMDTAKSELDAIYGGFTDYQKDALNSDGSTKVVKIENKLNVKYIVIGFLGGIIVTICIIILVYFMNNRIIRNDSIWKALCIINYGRIVVPKKEHLGRKLANMIRNINSQTGDVELICKKMLKKLHEGDQIILSGKVGAKAEDKFETLEKMLKKNGINVVCSSCGANDPNVIEKIDEKSKSFLIVHPYEDKTKKMMEQVYAMKDVGAEVIGVIEMFE